MHHHPPGLLELTWQKKEKEKNSLGTTLKHPRKPIFQWLSKLSVEGEIS